MRRQNKNSSNGVVHAIQRLFPALAVILFTSFWCSAQETRTQEIERQRDQKATHEHYDEPQKLEKKLFYIEDNKILERLTAGFRGVNLRLGNMAQGSGFALGPEYHLHNESFDSDFFVGAQLSTKLYQKYYIGWSEPRLANNHLSF